MIMWKSCPRALGENIQWKWLEMLCIKKQDFQRDLKIAAVWVIAIWIIFNAAALMTMNVRPTNCKSGKVCEFFLDLFKNNFLITPCIFMLSSNHAQNLNIFIFTFILVSRFFSFVLVTFLSFNALQRMPLKRQQCVEFSKNIHKVYTHIRKLIK